MLPQTDSARTEPTRSSLNRFVAAARTWMQRFLIVVICWVLCYGVLTLFGLIPVNRDFVETENGIEIFVYSGAFHSDLILPIETESFDWRPKFQDRQFATDTSWSTHLAVGWGDRDFYINTPRWKDLTVSTAAKALLIPSTTVMHVSHQLRPSESTDVRNIRISEEQYEQLVNYVLQSFETDENGGMQHIPNEAYGSSDAFFRGSGRYHSFRTCNCWVGDGLKSAGVKTGWFTPFPKTVFLYFPD